MKIYTKRGDKGETDLFGGERVSKTHIKVRAYGDVDAANCSIGFVAACHELPAFMREPLHSIMSDLFDLGAELATAERDDAKAKLEERLDTRVSLGRVAELEHLIDAADARLPQLKSFVLPTGSEPAARFHLARTQVRRAEQSVLMLKENGHQVRDDVIAYLNRLSDLMFVWARLSNLHVKHEDVQWKGLKSR
jgi:cob(I)alamin adenosyltransferase